MRRGPISVDLFAGAGGLALGLEDAGFDHVALVEWDADACRTLRANAGVARWESAHVYDMDVQGFVIGKPAEEIDLLAGGVPCQPFSLGGVHRGQEDERNGFPAFLEAVRRWSPKLVLVENVPGLVRPSFLPYFNYVCAQLALPHITRRKDESWRDHHQRLSRNAHSGNGDIRYSVEWNLLNAADFGVPQRRTRLFIQGIREDLGESCSWPTPTHSPARLAQALGDGSYIREHGLRRAPALDADLNVLPFSGLETSRWLTVRDALKGLPEPSPLFDDGVIPNHVYVAGARVYAGHTGSPLDAPAKTLKAGVHGVPGGEAVIILDDGNVRYLTIREAARIQTFPDQYRFEGSRSECMRQIGNAVPVRLAERIGQTLRAKLRQPETALAAVP